MVRLRVFYGRPTKIVCNRRARRWHAAASTAKCKRRPASRSRLNHDNTYTCTEMHAHVPRWLRCTSRTWITWITWISIRREPASELCNISSDYYSPDFCATSCLILCKHCYSSVTVVLLNVSSFYYTMLNIFIRPINNNYGRLCITKICCIDYEQDISWICNLKK